VNPLRRGVEEEDPRKRGGVFGFNAALSYCVEGGEVAGIHLWVIVLEILFVGGAGIR